MNKRTFLLTFSVISSLIFLGCQKKVADTASSTSTSKYLYFSAGGCYVGTLTGTKPVSTTASGLVNRVTLDTGQIQGIPTFDYYQAGLNLWPVGIADYDANYFLVNMMSSTAGFRVDKVKKSGVQEKVDYFTDVSNLNSYLRNINVLSDGSVLISRSTMVEKYNNSLARVQNTTALASYMSNPAGAACTGSATLISAVVPLPNSNILYAHAGGATNNRVFVIDKGGYDAAADCLGGVTFSGTSSPATVAVPTAAVLIPGTDPYQIIVATASSTAGNDQLWLFTVNSSTNAVTYVKSLYNNISFVKGVSAMTYDSSTSTLYVANGSTTLGNTVEKFTYDSAAQTLTRTGSFLGLNLDSQCINSMFISY